MTSLLKDRMTNLLQLTVSNCQAISDPPLPSHTCTVARKPG